MSTSEPPTLAEERTLLARGRTAFSVVLTCALVAHASTDVRPVAAPLCLAVAVVSVVALRLRAPRTQLLLVVAVVVLAAVGLLTAVH